MKLHIVGMYRLGMRYLLHVASKRDVEGRENTFFVTFYLGSTPGSRLLGHHSLVGRGGCLRNIN